MINWTKMSFDEAPIKIIDGDRGINYPKKNEFYSSGYCVFLSTSNVTTNGFELNNLDFISKEKDELLRKGKLERGDIVLTTRGTVGNVAFYNSLIPFNNIRINSGMVLLRVDTTKIDPYYLYIFLRSKLFSTQVLTQGSGSAQPQLPIGSLRNIVFPWKKVDEQNQIAKILSDLDSKIELNNKINAQLEAMAKLIYDYWFVQFDFPDAKGKPYKSSGGKMVFNEELKREIPEEWEVKRLGETLHTELGGTPSTKNPEYWDGDLPWLNSGEIANFPIIESELKITEKAIAKSATALMPAGTCPLSITRHLRPSILGIDACANQSVVGVYESENIKSSYIYPYLVNEIPRLMTLRSGAQQPHINKKTVDDSLMIIPSQEIQSIYHQKVGSMYKKIVNSAKENQKLSELRDWLLPMLMNGQVRVGKTEEAVSNG
jgi:type I restriction enzyme S subunit